MYCYRFISGMPQIYEAGADTPEMGDNLTSHENGNLSREAFLQLRNNPKPQGSKFWVGPDLQGHKAFIFIGPPLFLEVAQFLALFSGP